MTDKQLLPCPFCGDEAGVGTQYETPVFPVEHCFVNCVSCGAMMNPAALFSVDSPPSREEVIDLWNRRAGASDAQQRR